jgi:hypothetical protein
LKFATGSMFVVELVLPFLIFARLAVRSAFGFLLPEFSSSSPATQLVQSADHAALPHAIRRRGAARSCRLACRLLQPSHTPRWR